MVRPTIQKAGLFALFATGAILIVLVTAHVNPVFFGQTMLAQVGVNVGVLPNPYNSLDAQLNQKQAYLDEQQSYIDAQKAALASSTIVETSPAANPFLWYLIIAVVILAVLIILNFYFDWRRNAREAKGGGGKI